MDGGDALAQGLALVLAQGALQGLHLAVDVGLGHMVQIDQGQRSNTAARQGLDAPATHTTQTNHRQMQPAQARIAGLTIEPAQSAKATLQINVFAHSTRSKKKARREASGFERSSVAYFKEARRSLAAWAASVAG